MKRKGWINHTIRWIRQGWKDHEILKSLVEECDLTPREAKDTLQIAKHQLWPAHYALPLAAYSPKPTRHPAEAFGRTLALLVCIFGAIYITPLFWWLAGLNLLLLVFWLRQR